MKWTWLPNALTLLRCMLAFGVAFAVVQGAAVSHQLNAALRDWIAAGAPAPGDPGYPAVMANFQPADLLTWAATALATFLLAALTDLFDGIAARALNARTAFGAWLDPIADKLLVGLSLAALTVASGTLWLAIPSAVIICRDIYITWLRARLGGGYALPVMQTAKWKTALEMIAIGVLLAAPLLTLVERHFVSSTPGIAPQLSWGINTEIAGTVLLWIAAALSAWTAIRYSHAASHAKSQLRDTFE